MHDALSTDCGATTCSNYAQLAGLTVVAANPCVLAFDYGERWIGVAVGDTDTRIAHPLETIDAPSLHARFERITKLIEEWRPGLLVVGSPLSVEGERHTTTDRADRFARQLGGRYRLPVHRADERFTSVEATRELIEQGRGGRAHRTRVHAIAARIILDAYFHDHAA